MITLLQAADAAEVAVQMNEKSLWELFNSGGWLMWVLLLLGGVTIFIFVERFIAIRKASAFDINFMNRIRDHISEGKIKSAVDLCRKTDTPIARMVEKGLERLGIDSNGLEKMDRQILKTIIEYYGGGPVGADTLSISVGEAVESLEDFYEPYLIQQGYLKRTPRGRCVTRKAYELLDIKGGSYADEGLLF